MMIEYDSKQGERATSTLPLPLPLNCNHRLPFLLFSLSQNNKNQERTNAATTIHHQSPSSCQSCCSSSPEPDPLLSSPPCATTMTQWPPCSIVLHWCQSCDLPSTTNHLTENSLSHRELSPTSSVEPSARTPFHDRCAYPNPCKFLPFCISK